MIMYIISSKFNSTFRRIGKAMSVKMTAKAVGENSSSHYSVKNKFEHVFVQQSTSAKIWKIFRLLNRFLRLSLNENLLLMNLLSHSFICSLYLGILGFESEQQLPRGISAYLIYGDHEAVCLFSLIA